MTQLRAAMTTELATLLHGKKDVHAVEIYTVTLSGGTVYRWADGDRAVTWSGNTWAPGPGLARSEIELQAGVISDKLTVTVLSDDDSTINGEPLAAFAARGGFDGATVSVWTAFSELPTDAIVGVKHRFTGDVADLEFTEPLQFDLTLRNVLQRLDRPIPANVWEPNCTNDVYDAACGANRASFTHSGAVSVASTALKLTFGHTLPQANGYFNLGSVRFITGANAGLRRSVRSHTTSLFTLMQPLPFAAAVGDLFEVTRGCDLTRATCAGVFSNEARFRGAPYVPPPETVL